MHFTPLQGGGGCTTSKGSACLGPNPNPFPAPQASGPIEGQPEPSVLLSCCSGGAAVWDMARVGGAGSPSALLLEEVAAAH